MVKKKPDPDGVIRFNVRGDLIPEAFYDTIMDIDRDAIPFPMCNYDKSK
tara:strand:- start:316 stop:462 length:147 start_codon:yes stop_codon:yes gene_type:complete